MAGTTPIDPGVRVRLDTRLPKGKYLLLCFIPDAECIARFQDIVDYHSTVEDAARTAARAGVAKLVLTHYVPAMAPAQRDEWRTRAAEHFAGEIVLPDDLTTVEL